MTELEAFHLREHCSFSLETLSKRWVLHFLSKSQTFLGCRHMCSATELPYHLFYTACVHSHILRERISFLIFHIKQTSCEAQQCDRPLASPPFSLSPPNFCFFLTLFCLSSLSKSHRKSIAPSVFHTLTYSCWPLNRELPTCFRIKST